MDNIPRKNKEQTLFRRIAVPLLLILVAQTVLLTASLAASGMFTRLISNERAILEKQVMNRNGLMQSNLEKWMGISALAARITEAAERMIEEDAISLTSLETSSDACMPLLQEISGDLIAEFRARQVSGMYLVFNTGNLAPLHNEGKSGRRPGIFIRDMDPAASPSARNEDLLFEFAPSALVRSMNISTDINWTSMMRFSFAEAPADLDFFYRPFQTAYLKNGAGAPEDYGYWSVSVPSPEKTRTLTYSVPLILTDGTVYGVLGIDLTFEYLHAQFPYGELFDGTHGTYIFGRSVIEKSQWDAPAELYLTAAAVNGEHTPVSDGDVLHLTRTEHGTYTYTADGKDFSAALTFFDLYSNNAPFESDRWALIGAVESARFTLFPRQVIAIIVAIVLLTLLFGIITAIMFSRKIAGSISALSAEVVAATKHGMPVLSLSKTGIREIDVFGDAINTLSRERQEANLREQQLLAHERDYDSLTGVLNRRAFYRMAENALNGNTPPKLAALIMMDLDNLKNINERHGHDVGDRYIYRAARCFLDALPEGALIGRVSGDEFLILLHESEDADEILETIRNMHRSLSDSIFELPDRGKEALRATGGVAWYPKDSTRLEELVRMADFTMYRTKTVGKGSIHMFDAEQYDRQNSFYHQLEQLDDLLRRPDMLLNYHFQPIFSAHDGSVHAYEALMRPTLPLLRNPEEIIRLAHEERRLHDIELVTWNRSMACYRDLLLHRNADENAFVFINSIASEQLTGAEANEFLSANAEIIDRLVIEITEAENMDTGATAFKRELPGFSGFFALDDYGSGYNSQKTLLELTPKYIKVDMSIIRNIDNSTDKQTIVSNIVKYAHARDMLIIAEGLETASELQKVLELGVDLLQGYFLAKPAEIPGAIAGAAKDVIVSFSSAPESA
ncbi:MAG: EAL domain-containing protein [Lachnospiraceae bacterium]|nr:EAL domain-containing protein [Lachnospiraceae bacterium]